MQRRAFGVLGGLHCVTMRDLRVIGRFFVQAFLITF